MRHHHTDTEAEHKVTAWDRAGISLSLVCTVHCALLPVLALFLPFLESSSGNSLFHWLMAAFVVPIGVWAFVRGYACHGQKWILGLGLAGIAVLGLGLLLPGGHIVVFHGAHGDHAHGPIHDHGSAGFFFSQEGLLTLAGSLLLVIAHIGNLRAHRQAHGAHAHEHEPARHHG